MLSCKSTINHKIMYCRSKFEKICSSNLQSKNEAWYSTTAWSLTKALVYTYPLSKIIYTHEFLSICTCCMHCLLQTEIPVDGVAGFHGVDLAISTLPEQIISAQLHLHALFPVTYTTHLNGWQWQMHRNISFDAPCKQEWTSWKLWTIPQKKLLDPADIQTWNHSCTVRVPRYISSGNMLK